MNAIKAMKDLIVRLNQTTEKLTAATSCLETSRAAETCKFLAKTANTESKGLLVQFDEWAEQTKQPETIQPSLIGQLVLHDMEIYQVKEELPQAYILTTGMFNRAPVPVCDFFPISLEGIRVTLECRNQYDDLVRDRTELNQADIRSKLSSIWFTIISNLNNPEAGIEATNAFDQFVSEVENKLRAYEDLTVDGVQIIA